MLLYIFINPHGRQKLVGGPLYLTLEQQLGCCWLLTVFWMFKLFSLAVRLIFFNIRFASLLAFEEFLYPLPLFAVHRTITFSKQSIYAIASNQYLDTQGLSRILEWGSRLGDSLGTRTRIKSTELFIFRNPR